MKTEYRILQETDSESLTALLNEVAKDGWKPIPPLTPVAVTRSGSPGFPDSHSVHLFVMLSREVPR